MKYSEWIDLCEQHWQKYPAMQNQDLYKLIYQGVMGSEHLVQYGYAAQRLEREWQQVETFPSAYLWESVHPSERWGRVYLHPFKQAGGNWRMLLQAFIESSQQKGHLEELVNIWDVLLSEPPAWPIPFEDLERWIQNMKQQGFPAQHHSQPYRELYRPSYRLLTRKNFDHLVKELPDG
jgi:GNAT superfamily N-acetyltransferase